MEKIITLLTLLTLLNMLILGHYIYSKRKLDEQYESIQNDIPDEIMDEFEIDKLVEKADSMGIPRRMYSTDIETGIPDNVHMYAVLSALVTFVEGGYIEITDVSKKIKKEMEDWKCQGK